MPIQEIPLGPIHIRFLVDGAGGPHLTLSTNAGAPYLEEMWVRRMIQDPPLPRCCDASQP